MAAPGERKNDPEAVTLDALPPAFAATAVAHPRTTVRPEPPALAHDSEGLRREVEALRASLPPLVAGGAGAALELGGTLGEGGMGVVRLGRQRVLGRTVAVKTLRDGAPPGASLRLLREAWIAATLEHPNVVPVYDLGVSADGAPVLVLRLVEGASWAALLAAPELARTYAGPGADLLDFHLRVLVRICEAVALAHERGVLHRDIKPDNVMLGRHGETYLVDWGIAVALAPDPTGRLPFVGDAGEVAGTPAYMPPELLRADVARMGPGVDVYLLGATLHEIVAGHPPHTGTTLAALARSVLLGPPPLGDEVPAELAALVARATRLDPSDRYPTVDAFREAVLVFLGHRGSHALAEGAARAGARLEALAAAAATDRSAVYAALGEARFGYRQALAAWPENGPAREGLRRVLAAAAGLELRLGAPGAAATLLDEMDEAPPALRERVAAALAQDAADRAEGARLLREHDAAFGRRTRAALLLALALLWIATPAVVARTGLFADGPRGPARPLAVFGAIQLAVAGLFGVWARRSLLGTATNRRAMGLALGMAAFQTVLALALSATGADAASVFAVFLVYWAFASFCASLLVHPAWLLYVLTLLGALAGHLLVPGASWSFIAAANVATLVFPALELRALRREGQPLLRRPGRARDGA